VKQLSVSYLTGWCFIKVNTTI